MDISQSWELIKHCGGWELALGGFFFVVTLWVRSWRWKYLLAAQQPVEFRSCLSASNVGLLANNILPFRLGGAGCEQQQRDKKTPHPAGLRHLRPAPCA